MRIVSYNIWNTDVKIDGRIDAVIETLRRQKADVMCLQEVTEENFRLMQVQFPHMHGILEESTQLAVFCKFPLKHVEKLPFGIAISVTVQGEMVNVTNLHLPWNSALNRERAIVEIQKYTDQRTGMSILAGDFNCSADSSVHRYLKGEQSLLNTDACWFDLAESYAEIHGTTPENTVDFRNNTRWGKVQDINTIEKNQRFDRILLRNPYPEAFPVLEKFEVFGKEICHEIGIMPSDHYGVMVQMSL